MIVLLKIIGLVLVLPILAFLSLFVVTRGLKEQWDEMEELIYETERLKRI